MNAPLHPTVNDDTITAWNTVLFDKWIQFRPLVTSGLATHGEALLCLHPPDYGCDAIDIGCGFGDTTRRLAELVGPDGHAVGIDAAPRFIETARAESRPLDNTTFAPADVQLDPLAGPYDYAFSRFGTMFFQNPVAAFRNVHRHLRAGGRLAMAVWRRREDNAWLYEAERVVREFLEEPQEIDQPTCGPGPFSLASADFVTTVLNHAGFENVTLRRFDCPIAIGRDTDEAIAFAMSLGPAGEIIRLCGEEGQRERPAIEAALRSHFDALPRDRLGRVLASSSVWLVAARVGDSGR